MFEKVSMFEKVITVGSIFLISQMTAINPIHGNESTGVAAKRQRACGVISYEPFGLTQQAAGKGHVGVYASDVCTHDLVSVSSEGCTEEEKADGIIVGRFPTIVKGSPLVWAAAPKTLNLYGVEKSADIPMISFSNLLDCYQESYWDKHLSDKLKPLAPKMPKDLKKLEKATSLLEKLRDQKGELEDNIRMSEGAERAKHENELKKLEVKIEVASKKEDSANFFQKAKFLKDAEGQPIELPSGSWRTVIGSGLKQDITIFTVNGDQNCNENPKGVFKGNDVATWKKYGQFSNNCERMAEKNLSELVTSPGGYKPTTRCERFKRSPFDLGIEFPERAVEQFVKTTGQEPGTNLKVEEFRQIPGDRWKSSPVRTMLEFYLPAPEQVKQVRIAKSTMTSAVVATLIATTGTPPIASAAIWTGSRLLPRFKEDKLIMKTDLELGDAKKAIELLVQKKNDLEEKKQDTKGVENEISNAVENYGKQVKVHWGTPKCWEAMNKSFSDLMAQAESVGAISKPMREAAVSDKRTALAKLIHAELDIKLDKAPADSKDKSANLCHAYPKDGGGDAPRVPLSRTELAASILPDTRRVEELGQYKGVNFDAKKGFAILANVIHNDLVAKPYDRRRTADFDRDWQLLLNVADHLKLNVPGKAWSTVAQCSQTATEQKAGEPKSKGRD